MLTRTECKALRAIAILGIMLHNYCHWLGRAVKENEFTFTSGKAVQFFRHIGEADPAWLPIDFASFLGHYGVPIFLFLSAYGLVVKYEDPKADPIFEPSAQSFLWKHFKKLFLMMIFGYALFLCVDFVTPSPHRYQAADVLAQLLLVNNFLPNPDKIIWPGPYWFFGLMMQLYVVYRLVLYKRSSWWGIVIVALCTVAELLCPPESETLNRLRYNCVGAMLPFVAGMVYARLSFGRDESRNVHKTTLIAVVVAALFFVLWGSTNFLSWLFVPLAVPFLWIAIVRLLPQKAVAALAWMGTLSAAIFVLHPIFRKIFIPISRNGDVYTGLIIYIMCTIVAAYAYVEWQKGRASRG